MELTELTKEIIKKIDIAISNFDMYMLNKEKHTKGLIIYQEAIEYLNPINMDEITYTVLACLAYKTCQRLNLNDKSYYNGINHAMLIAGNYLPKEVEEYGWNSFNR